MPVPTSFGGRPVMDEQIIKQPGGLYAIYSTITDTIHMYDATADDITQYFIDRETRRLRERLNILITAVSLDRPEDVYYQFAMTWDEALEADREHGGDVWQEFTTEEIEAP